MNVQYSGGRMMRPAWATFDGPMRWSNLVYKCRTRVHGRLKKRPIRYGADGVL